MNVVPFPIRGKTLLYGLGQDITARKMAEKEVEDARVFVDGIIQAASPSMVVVTTDMRVAFANRSFYESFGLSTEAVLHRVFFEIGKNDFDVDGLRENILEVFQGGVPLENFEFRYHRAGGEEMALNLSASLIRRSAPFAPMVVIVITDITERKQMQEALERSSGALSVYRLLHPGKPFPHPGGAGRRRHSFFQRGRWTSPSGGGGSKTRGSSSRRICPGSWKS